MIRRRRCRRRRAPQIASRETWKEHEGPSSIALGGPLRASFGEKYEPQ
jgi:hypothetical protein